MKEIGKRVMLLFSGIIMVGQTLHMMTQHLISPNSVYPARIPGNLDFWFDWTFILLMVIPFIMCVVEVGGYLDRRSKRDRAERPLRTGRLDRTLVLHVYSEDIDKKTVTN